MNLRRRKRKRARAVDKLRGAAGRSRKSQPTRMAASLHGKLKRSGPNKTVQGVGMAGRAAGRSGRAMVRYTSRKAAGKPLPLLVSLPAFTGATIASIIAVRKMRQGVKQTVPDA